jgi:hypothetical protein
MPTHFCRLCFEVREIRDSALLKERNSHSKQVWTVRTKPIRRSEDHDDHFQFASSIIGELISTFLQMQRGKNNNKVDDLGLAVRWKQSSLNMINLHYGCEPRFGD